MVKQIKPILIVREYSEKGMEKLSRAIYSRDPFGFHDRFVKSRLKAGIPQVVFELKSSEHSNIIKDLTKLRAMDDEELTSQSYTYVIKSNDCDIYWVFSLDMEVYNTERLKRETEKAIARNKALASMAEGAFLPGSVLLSKISTVTGDLCFDKSKNNIVWADRSVSKYFGQQLSAEYLQ